MFVQYKVLMACPESDCGYGNQMNVYWFGFAVYKCAACGHVDFGRVKLQKKDKEK